jgi:hypothetical protein
MGCRTYRRLLMSREGELTREETDRLTAHLAACAGCAREAEEATRMHSRLGAVRLVDAGVPGEEERVDYIVRAAFGDERAPSRGGLTLLLDRFIDMVASPLYRYASATALLVTVASALWQGGMIAADVHQLEARQSRTWQERQLIPTVEYAVALDQDLTALTPELMRTPGVRIDNGMLLLSSSMVDAARGIVSSPGGVFTHAPLPRREMHTMIATMNRTGVHVRPVLTFKNEKGV